MISNREHPAPIVKNPTKKEKYFRAALTTIRHDEGILGPP